MPVHSKTVVFFAAAIEFGKFHSGGIFAQSVGLNDFQTADQAIATGVGSLHHHFIGSGFFDRDVAGADHYAQRLPHNFAHFTQPGIHAVITGKQVNIGLFVEQTGYLAALPDNFQLDVIIFQHNAFSSLFDCYCGGKHRSSQTEDTS